MSSCRKDSLVKVLGTCQFTDDIAQGDVLHGQIVGATTSKGILKKIFFDPDFDWSQFTIITYQDLVNLQAFPAQSCDEPILVDSKINYFGQPVVLLAHPIAAKNIQAIRHISLEIEELPPVLHRRVDESISSEDIFASKTISIGNPTQAFEEADCVFENIYSTQAQEHWYLETQIVVADFDCSSHILRVRGAMQAPFNVMHSLKTVFQHQVSDVIVSPQITGGAFGGREDFTAQIAIHASLLSLKSGKKVQIKLSRSHDMKFSTKRHPSSTEIKIGIKDNRIHCLALDFLLDAGAYETISGIVLNRSMLHTCSYQIPHVAINGRAVRTNTPPNGAFRGFGAPQVFFALESHISHVAYQLNIDEVEFRRQYLYGQESLNLSGQKICPDIGMNQVFDQLISFSCFFQLKTEVEKFNRSHHYRKRGLGFSSFYHGTGYTGYQDIDGHISLALNLLPNGSVEILSSVIEFGQGSHTLLPQIAAKTLKLPLDLISVKNVNTQITPNSGATVASRTNTVLGGLVTQACQNLHQQLGPYSDVVSYRQRVIKLLGPNQNLLITQNYHRPEAPPFDYQSLRGHAYENYSSAALLALVEVDLLDYTTRVDQLHAVFNVGSVIDQDIALGQVHGGFLQGLGLALTEEMKMGSRGYLTDSLSTYHLPTAIDTPRIHVKFLEDVGGRPLDPKGLGEIPISGVAPAVANAINQAIGVRLSDLPLTPEKIFAKLNSTKPRTCIPPSNKHR